MDVYATTENLSAWLSADSLTDGDTMERDLRYASIVVARACNLSLYSGDTEFLPPIVDATCAQAASWIALDFDPSKLGLDKAPVKKSSILSGDVERDTSGLLAAYQEAVTCLAPAARDILIASNLLWQPAPLFDSSGALPLWGTEPARFPFELANELDWPFI